MILAYLPVWKPVNLFNACLATSLDKLFAGGVQGEGEQQKKSDMASHYAKKFEDLYEVFNKRVGGGAGRK